MRVLNVTPELAELSDIAKRAPRSRRTSISADRAIGRYLGPLTEETDASAVARLTDFSDDIGDKSLRSRSLPRVIPPDFSFVMLARRCIAQKAEIEPCPT